MREFRELSRHDYLYGYAGHDGCETEARGEESNLMPARGSDEGDVNEEASGHHSEFHDHLPLRALHAE
jgi:hypothetical protein